MKNKFTLIIGNKNYSSWSLRPWLVMKYFHIPFHEILIPLYQEGYKQKILKYSPSGKVPLLIHKRLAVWETIAICEYLAEQFPKKNLWPKNKEARALARAVSAEMHAGFMNLRKNCPMNVRENKPKVGLNSDVKKDIERITNIWEDCRRRFGKGGDFLFGKFCIADAFYAPIVWRFNTYKIPLSGIPGKYFDAMIDLPAMQKWREASIQEPWAIGH